MSISPSRGALPKDESHDVLIVIPTVANPSVLVPAFDRLCRNLDGLRVHVVASINPLDPAHGAESEEEIRRTWLAYVSRNPGCHFTIYNHGAPAGFGGAINLGLRVAIGGLGVQPIFSTCPITMAGIAPLTVIFNDDLVVTRGWLSGMLDALASPEVEEWSEIADPETHERPKRPMADYIGSKSVGLIGPITNVACGIQVIGDEEQKRLRDVGWDKFAEEWRAARAGSVVTATFLSGYCMGITHACMEALSFYQEGPVGGWTPGDAEPGLTFQWLFDERYTIAGYEDNDLCARADFAGYRAVVAAEVFIGHLGHQTFDAAFPEMDRGMRNRGVYYDVWRDRLANIGRRTVAAYRVRFDVPNDLVMFRTSLVATGRLVDGIAILLTRNPAEMMRGEEFQQELAAGRVPADMLELLAACQRAPAGAAEALARWAHGWAGKHPETRRPKVTGVSWKGDFNERVERNALLAIAEKMGADWILSIDHDEYFEPRVDRALLERVMSHPDPLVQQFDIAFINHWENNRMYRTDRPWGDGGSWKGGMRGFRLFRVCKANPRRILAGGHNGLHCGNVPGVDGSAKRVFGGRMRHFGYMRWQDRQRKEARYNEQDPNPDPMLVGGTSYAHINRDEGMVLSAFTPENGIGLHMLVHEGERADDIGRILDQLHGIVDRIVLVWTGDWTSKSWLEDGFTRSVQVNGLQGEGLPPGGLNARLDTVVTHRAGAIVHSRAERPEEEVWYGNGPGLAMARMAAHFGVEWVHHPLADNIGAARNAGIDALRASGPNMGWSLFFDPDEHFAPTTTPIILRRMAEVGDSYGWIFRFLNRHTDGSQNTSESCRMARLDPEGLMRMNGRVHESFSKAVGVLQARGLGNILRVAPFVIMNTGLSRDADAMQKKLDFYMRLTVLDLLEDPHNPTAWTTLGLYWLNEGADLAGLECLSRATQCATGEYVPFRELALVYGRLAHACLAEAEVRLGNHSLRQQIREHVEALAEIAPPLPRLGHVVAGVRGGISNEVALASLPPFHPPGEAPMEASAKPTPDGCFNGPIEVLSIIALERAPERGILFDGEFAACAYGPGGEETLLLPVERFEERPDGGSMWHLDFERGDALWNPNPSIMLARLVGWELITGPIRAARRAEITAQMEAALGDLDEVFIEGIGTVRRCLDCRVPVRGGPTRCEAHAEAAVPEGPAGTEPAPEPA